MRRVHINTSFAVAAVIGLVAATAVAIDLAGFHSSPQLAEVADVVPAKQSGTAEAVDASRTGSRGDAIEVHGHWTIEIRDPDGSVARSIEFDNALTADGSRFLAHVLSGLPVTRRQIHLTAADASPPYGPFQEMGGLTPCQRGRIHVACVIAEAGDTLPGWEFFNTLRSSVPVTGPNAGKLVLTGSATPPLTGDVVEVHSVFATVGDTGTGHWRFTTARLPNPMRVEAGQAIALTVVIGFR